MEHIGLVGYYGSGNYGDELFYETWRQKLGYENTRMVCPQDNLDDIDKIIIGGGDLVWNYDVNNNYFNSKWNENGRKVYVYGVGVALPSEVKIDDNVKKLYQYFFNEVEYISVRDKKSQEWFKTVLDIDVEVVGDAAWNFKTKTSIGKQPKRVGVTYRRNDWFQCDDVVKQLLPLVNEDYRIRFIPLQGGFHNTRVLHQVLFEEIKRSTDYAAMNLIPINSDSYHTYAEIDSCEFYITTAFHGLITGLKTRVPTLCLSRHNKFTQLLKEVNMEWILCKNNDELVAKLKMILNGEYKFSKELNIAEENAQRDLNKFIAKHIEVK